MDNSINIKDISPFDFLAKVGGFFKKNESNNSSDNLGYYENILPNGDYETTCQFLQKVVDLMMIHIKNTNNRSEKILRFQHPEDLKQVLDLEIKKEPVELSKIIDDCEMVMNYAVKTGHPRFFNQLSQGLDIVSLAGEWVTATTNTNMFTYEIAPVYNLIEMTVIDKMRILIGWNEPCDGLLNPGGSISNLYAVQAAKHFFFPQTKLNGLFKMPKLVLFTSEHSHYSVHRAATILGLGLNQVKNVPVDEKGKIIPEKLEFMIQESLKLNEVPFMVILTAGTTVLGAFDPIEPVADLCSKYNLWLHVDAAWGGGALLSRKYRNLMKGIDRADSVTWNPHKLMGALLQASVFLVKKKGILLNCNEMNATYLFQQDKHYDVCYDTGDKTIQCGRHVDVFKVWLMWRAKGDEGFEKQMDRLFELANLLYEQLKIRQNYEIVLENPEMTNICFWYVPISLQKMDKNSNEYKQKLHQVAPKIKEKMMVNGSLMVGYQPLDDKPNFFRAIISNAATKEEDILFMLDEIEKLGKDL
ncbi:unnamed protein product [Brachionus calyciflorus]|uniref:Glutamate decarboxylase n=1 Tax=Brachionus calyciflorus TaxID=104777 RepID=A0A814FMK3_9BILA|nr:unnamed protein product [Brachionus calyciflorus]